MAAPLSLDAMRYLQQVRVTPNCLGEYPDLQSLAGRFEVTTGEMNLVLDSLQGRTTEAAYASLSDRLGPHAPPAPRGLSRFLSGMFGREGLGAGR